MPVACAVWSISAYGVEPRLMVLVHHESLNAILRSRAALFFTPCAQHTRFIISCTVCCSGVSAFFKHGPASYVGVIVTDPVNNYIPCLNKN